MAGRLEGKVAIVTGAGTGIGEAIAYKFAREGARVVVNSLPGDPVEDVANAIREKSGEAVAYIGDVSDEGHAIQCVQTAINTFSKLDVLVNNAGIHYGYAEIDQFPVDKFDCITTNNIRSVFLMTKYAMPHLRQTRGNLLNAGSEAGYIGSPQNTPYGGTKGWIHAFTIGVAVEQAKYGVRANCYCPGPIDTSWTYASSGALTEEMEQMLMDATPMARRGTPEEVANLCAFLTSDEASFITASLHLVDGGIAHGTGSAGRDVPPGLRSQPKGELDLKHSLDSTKG